VFAFLGLTPRAQAQKGETVPAPIAVRVNDAAGEAIVVQGTAVTLAGESVPLGDKKQVRVEIVTPAKKTVTLTAALLAEGKFSISFKDTQEVGTYGVTAWSPDGASQAKAGFKVAGGADLSAITKTALQSFDALGAETSAAVTAVEQAVAGRDDLPPKVQQNLASLKQQLAELPARLTDVRVEIGKITHIAEQYPGAAPALAPVVDAIREAGEKAGDTQQKLAEKTKALPKKSEICDRLDNAIEALSFVSLVFDFFGGAFEKTVQLATDKALPDVLYNAARPVEKRTAEEKFALAETLKGAGAALTGGKANLKVFFISPAGLVGDTVQYLTGLGFDKYCERFQGPIEATFKADFFNEGSRFWGYTTKLRGRLVLRYEKKHEAGGGPVPLTGELEGNGESFTMYEDLMAFNTYMRGYVLFKQLVSPIGSGKLVQAVGNMAGKFARYFASPAYFLVPVTGVLAGQEVTLNVGDATVDFNERIKGTAHYVLNPPGSLFPSVQKFDLPIQKAQFVLSRGLRKDAKLTVTSVKQGDVTIRTLEKTFTRQEANAASEFKIDWTVNVKACSPDCP
jgi:hypothetical protein